MYNGKIKRTIGKISEHEKASLFNGKPEEPNFEDEETKKDPIYDELNSLAHKAMADGSIDIVMAFIEKLNENRENDNAKNVAYKLENVVVQYRNKIKDIITQYLEHNHYIGY